MTQKIKVMMVDDETRFREVTSTLLNKKGFETTIAASGEEAISIIEKNPQDVVVLDVKMEGMDGHATLAEIKKISPETQVIMLTGHGNLESAVSSRDLAAFDYLNKPCDIDLLAIKINEAYAVRQSKVQQAEKKVKDIMTGIENSLRRPGITSIDRDTRRARKVACCAATTLDRTPSLSRNTQSGANDPPGLNGTAAIDLRLRTVGSDRKA